MSRIFLASNSQPFDVSAYELCSEALDMVEDMVAIYRSPNSSDEYPHAKLELQGSDIQTLSVVYFGIGHGLSIVLVCKGNESSELSVALKAMGSEIISILYP